MTKEQIIRLWKIGYSKIYMYDMEYHELKASGRFRKNMKAKELKEKARHNVESILWKAYNSREI